MVRYYFISKIMIRLGHVVCVAKIPRWLVTHPEINNGAVPLVTGQSFLNILRLNSKRSALKIPKYIAL